VELPSGPHSVDGDVAEFTDPMKKIALRLVAIGGTGAFAQAPHALDALVDVPGVFTARGVSRIALDMGCPSVVWIGAGPLRGHAADLTAK